MSYALPPSYKFEHNGRFIRLYKSDGLGNWLLTATRVNVHTGEVNVSYESAEVVKALLYEAGLL